MATTKYGKYVIPASIKTFRPGENPSLEFVAAPYGINATWAVMSTTKIPDPEVRKKLRENPHTHTFYQFITSWGGNPYNIGEYDIESCNALGEELEDHITTWPSVYAIPPGLMHGYGSRAGRVSKPGFHMDLSFVSAYKRTDFADPGEINEAETKKLNIQKTPGSKYDKYVVKADVRALRLGEHPSLVFNASQYGVNAEWVVMSMSELPDEEIRKKLREIPHTHDFQQFITFFGSNPYNIGEFDAEIPIYLGEEREEHVITKPTVLNIPPGLIHGMSVRPGRVGKPVYHIDLSFTDQYKRVDLPD